MIHDNKPPLEELALEHHGVKGMKWGVRRGRDGARPIAKTLDRSRFGRLANANAERYMRKQAARAAETPQQRAQRHARNRRVAASVLRVAGTAAAIYIVSQHGKTPASFIGTRGGGLRVNPNSKNAEALARTAFRRGQDFASNGLNQRYTPGSHMETMAFRRGQDFASRAMAQEDWSRKVSELSKSIADANKSADQFLIKNGMGMARTAISA